jgi:hypothetical protein
MATEPANPTADGGGDTQDIVVTDRELFDSALSDEPATPPASEPQAPEGAEPPPTEETQPGPARDEMGRFTAQPKQPAQPQPTQPRQPQPPPQEPQPHQVPLRELLDERERRYRAQAEADQIKQHWARIQHEQEQQRLAETRAQQPQTIYDNPDEYLVNNVIMPLRQEGHMAILQMRDGLSREFAEAQFGANTVNAALNAIAQVRQTPHGDFVFRQIMGSGHPYGALVRWFNHARAQQQIGPDPTAWVNKQKEAWMNDPAVHAEVLRRAQQARRPAPSSSPNVRLPPSLSSLPASAGRTEDQGDLSDASLWLHATK